MTTATQQRLLTTFISCFALFISGIGLLMLYWTRHADLTVVGRLCVGSLVASAVSFALFLLVFTRRAYAADMTYGVNFFSLAFGPAPGEASEKLAWVAARRVVASWLGIAVSMAVLVVVETRAGHWS